MYIILVKEEAINRSIRLIEAGKISELRDAALERVVNLSSRERFSFVETELRDLDLGAPIRKKAVGLAVCVLCMSSFGDIGEPDDFVKIGEDDGGLQMRLFEDSRFYDLLDKSQKLPWLDGSDVELSSEDQIDLLDRLIQTILDDKRDPRPHKPTIREIQLRIREFCERARASGEGGTERLAVAFMSDYPLEDEDYYDSIE